MPRLTAISNDALARLSEELRFAPRDALLRDIERAEDLAAELDPDRWYPEEWVVFRVTGFRPDLDESATILGSALLADLSAFVERLSEAAVIEESDLPEAPDLSALCARWSVSSKTIARYRKRGLIARRVRTKIGRPKLVFRIAVVEAFETREDGLIERARGFTRIEPELIERVTAIAHRARRRFGWSLNHTAERIAPRIGRSLEGVRQVLLRAEERSEVFRRRAPMTGRERRLAWRACARGVPFRDMEARWDRTRVQLRRAIDLQRAEILGDLDLAGPESPTFERDDAADVLLVSEHVRIGLATDHESDLLALIESARAPSVPLGVEESARSTALRFLVWRAERTIGEFNERAPTAGSLDRAETDLRWAHRLAQTLVRTQLHVMAETLEGSLGRPLDRMRAHRCRRVVADSLAALGREALAHDPFGGGRLAARSTIAVTRVAAELGALDDTRKATPRLRAGIDLGDWARALTPWGQTLMPCARWLSRVPQLDEPERTVLTCRYGPDGRAPMTLDETARALDVSRVRLPRIERRGIYKARRA